MTAIYVDADACPVREEVYRVASRLHVAVHVVSNGSRPIRGPGLPNVQLVVVSAGADAADDWIAERISADDVCATADIRLAARCLGGALAGRALTQHLREVDIDTGGPPALKGRVRPPKDAGARKRATQKQSLADRDVGELLGYHCSHRVGVLSIRKLV